jgi:hypothetical protein
MQAYNILIDDPDGVLYSYDTPIYVLVYTIGSLINILHKIILNK